MKKTKSTENVAVLDEPMTDVMENSTEAEEASAGIPDLGELKEEPKELNEVDRLTNRRTGFWELALEEADVRWIRNQCNSKFNFVGPNEAFMLMNCYLGFSAALARQEQAEKENVKPGPFMIQAIALEACALMINRFEGSGLESAQRIFRIAVALNGPISEMKQLDEIIAKVKQATGEDSSED